MLPTRSNRNTLPTMVPNPIKPEEAWPISYDSGYAKITTTHRALWESLPEEPVEDFELFKTYRNLDPLQGRRTLMRLSKITGRELIELVPLVSKWSWDLRCQAYDQFVEEDRQYCIIQRQNEVMGRHADTGRRLFDLAYRRLEDTVELMTPKVALEVMRLAIELEKETACGGSGAPRSGMYTQVNINGTPNPHSAGSIEIIQQEAEPKLNDRDRIAQIIEVLKQTGVTNIEPIIEPIIEPVVEPTA